MDSGNSGEFGRNLNGLLKLKDSSILLGYEKLVEPLFLLATEVSCIYSQGGKLRLSSRFNLGPDNFFG